MTHPLDELCLRPLEEVGDLVAQRQVNPVELTEAVLARIERLQPELNAYITVTADRALADAKAAWGEVASGKLRSPLHGVPIAHKDLFDVKGVLTTAGSKVLAGNIADADAAVVSMLGDAGAISVGKLGMHEWAYGSISDNVHFGPVRNPWDTTRVPGGSSGGSGAAVAAGLCFAATGSDTGGSIRMPAAACGCVGLMPTYGRVSLRGAVPLSWTLDHAGPLTRTVRDAAIVLQAIAGNDLLDPATEHVAVPDYMSHIEEGPKGLRVGVPKQDFFWAKVDAEVAALVRKAIAGLDGAGAEVLEVDFSEVEAYAGAFGPIILSDAAAYHARYLPARRADYSPQVLGLLDAGTALPGVAVASAMRVLHAARNGGADALLEGVDVLAVPTMPCIAPTIDEARARDLNGRLASLTGTFDITGQPAIAVPCGLANGMPASISFVARRWDEVTLLRAARAYELVRGEFPSPPV